MSTADENTIDVEGGALSAEEQAQFDAMRGDSAGSNASSPEQLVSSEETPAVVAGAEVAAKAEPKPQGEVDLDDDSEDEKIDPETGLPPKRISYHKYRRLQTQFKNLETKLGQTAEERARIDERLKIINEALTTPAPVEQQAAVDEDPEPDLESNIFEHNAWLKRQMTRDREARVAFENSIREQNEESNIASTYRQDANRVAQSDPNFGKAYNFLLTTRAAELRAGGWTDETKIQQQIVKEEKGLVRNTLQEGKSPAERIVAMAKAKGFAPPAAAAAAEQVPGVPLGRMTASAAAPAAARPAASGVPSVTEQVRLAAQGVAASTSLSSAGGAPLEPLTSAKLLSMPEEEFDAAVASLPKAKLRELFGD